MRLRHFFTFLLPILVACSEKNSRTSASDAGQQEINTLRAALIEATIQGRIVERIAKKPTNGEQAYVLTFTDRNEISVPTRLVQTLVEDVNAWRVMVTFSNGELETLFLLGSTLGISAANVKLNPTGITPLSALAQFSTPAPGRIRIVVPGRGATGIMMQHAFTAQGTDFSLPILGLYADHANRVEFHFSDVAGNELITDTVTVQTEPLLATFNLNILKNTLPEDDDGVFIFADHKLAFDQQGEIRWAHTDPKVHYVFRKLPNGNMTAANAETLVVYHFGSFSETTMLGEIVERYDVSNLIHHEALLSAHTNSYFVAGNSFPVENEDSFTDGLPEEDEIIEIDRATHRVIKKWDFNTILDPTRPGIHDTNMRPDDWAHINAVYYDEEDNTIVISARSQSTVAKVDYDTGNLIWLLSAHQQWPERFRSFLLTPVDATGTAIDIDTPGFWPSGQHAPLKLPNGDILLFDNGNNRGLYTGEPVGAPYSRAAQYRIDKVAMTIQLVDVFPDHQDWFTFATGDVDYLANTGGRLISFLWGDGATSAIPRMIELDSAGNVVFEATLNVGSNYYRAEKFRLYQGIQ